MIVGMATTRLVELIDYYKNAHGVSDAELARRIGMTRENLRLWRVNGLRQLPDRDNLTAVARTINRPYRQILSAALLDTGYLTESEQQSPRPFGEVLHDAIAILTEATRLTNSPVRQSSSGQWEADPDPRAALPIDWAEFVTLVLAGAAANVGGTEQALAGRPGSWEAERVRQTLQSTVGADDEYLLQHRTEPVVIDLWVESILRDSVDTHYDSYRDAELELARRADAIPQPDDLPPGPFLADDPRIAAVDWISVDDNGYLIVKGKTGFGDDPADIALLTELHNEAQASRAATPGEIAYDEAHDAIAALGDALDAQELREHTDYAEQLTAAIDDRLATLNLPAPVTISVTLAPQDHSYDDFEAHAPSPYPRNAIEQAINDAIANTPTPATLPGSPLDRLAAPQTP